MDRGPPGESLPALEDDIDISRADLEAAADAAGHFRRDQGCARAEKRVIDQLAGPAVVDDRTAHALDRLLRSMPQLCSRCRLPNGLLLAISHTVVCLRSPCQCPALPSRTAYQ